jgi:hypothetical protein
MHEIAGIIYYVVEQEAKSWIKVAENKVFQDHILANCFNLSDVEANTFWLFERVMKDLDLLYDPTPSFDGQPHITHYCTALQGN